MLDLDVGPQDGRPLAYLATPYSHDDPSVMQTRYEAANATAARLMKEHGLNVYSPITHSHPLATDHELPETWEFWQGVDEDYLSVSYCLLVMTLHGYQDSTGVTAEREIAHDMGIPVRFVNPKTLTFYRDPRDAFRVAPGDVPGVPEHNEGEER